MYKIYSRKEDKEIILLYIHVLQSAIMVYQCEKDLLFDIYNNYYQTSSLI